MNPSDNQLDSWLTAWETPPVPPLLERRVWNAYRDSSRPIGWFRWLLQGRVQLPVPAVAGMAAVAVIAVLALSHAARVAPPMLQIRVAGVPLPTPVLSPVPVSTAVSSRQNLVVPPGREERKGRAQRQRVSLRAASDCGAPVADAARAVLLVYRPDFSGMQAMDVPPSHRPVRRSRTTEISERAMAETCRLDQVAAVR